MPNLPAIPDADPGLALSVADAEQIERQITEALATIDRIDPLEEGRQRERALEVYLRGKEQQAPIRGAQRRTEGRIGQLLGDAKPGRPKGGNLQADESFLHPAERHDFRLLGRALAGECEIGVDEWRQTRAPLVALIRRRLNIPIEVRPPRRDTYHTLVVDPPWPIEKIAREEAPNQDDIDYPTMSEDDLRRWDLVKRHAADDAHLYLWTTHKHLPLALELVVEWGFRYQCLLTWVKNVGMTPFSWMYSTEHIVFARRGSLDLLVKGRRLDFHAKTTGHSRKPDEFYDLISAVSPEPRIDLFAREDRPGFEPWGNEIDDE